MDDEDFLPETCYYYSFDVNFCRILNNLFMGTNMAIKIGIEIFDDDKMEIAMTKINHWIENHFAKTIAVHCQDTIAFDVLLDEGSATRLDNPLMITPGEPADSHMLVLLQSKIEAIADGAFMISSIEGKSDNAQGLEVVFVGDAAATLPDMEDWLAGPSWFTIPWWRRNDVSMIDSLIPEGHDPLVRPVWAGTFAFLEDLADSQPAQIITGDFTPRIVNDDNNAPTV